MTAVFQNVMDTLTKEFLQAHAFIDVSEGAKIEHIALVEKLLTKLDITNSGSASSRYQVSNGWTTK